MKITVAGNKKEYQDGMTVNELIEKEEVENPLYVSVTINEEFIEREIFDKTLIKDGDDIEFLYFMGGGTL